MASSAVDKRKIDELIWGNLESEIIEAKYSLYVASGRVRDAKVFSVTLLGGFLNFIHHKCGLVPKLRDGEKAGFDSIGGDFDDRASWVKSLWEGEEGGAASGDPYFLRQVVDQNGDKHDIVVLMDTFSLFECGMILNKTRLEGESKFSSDEISREFHVYEKKLAKMLLYFKYLSHAGRVRAHTLVLRPTKLAEMLYRLDDEMQSLTNYPNQVLKTEEWEEKTGLDRMVLDIQMSGNTGVCNEENFRELLKAHSIEIPHVQFLTFYEYIRDKLTTETAKEWADIRDTYIAEVKESIKSIILSPGEKDLAHAKNLLAKAREAVEEKHYAESVRHSSNAMEESLDVMITEEMKWMKLDKRINAVTERSPDLRNYRTGLHFIRKTRNELSHPSGVDECDEVSANFALDVMDQFLMSIENSLHSQ